MKKPRYDGRGATVLYLSCYLKELTFRALGHVIGVGALFHSSSGLSFVCSTTPLGCGALVILAGDRSAGQAIDTYFVVMVLNPIQHNPMVITPQAVDFNPLAEKGLASLQATTKVEVSFVPSPR